MVNQTTCEHCLLLHWARLKLHRPPGPIVHPTTQSLRPSDEFSFFLLLLLFFCDDLFRRILQSLYCDWRVPGWSQRLSHIICTTTYELILSFLPNISSRTRTVLPGWVPYASSLLPMHHRTPESHHPLKMESDKEENRIRRSATVHTVTTPSRGRRRRRRPWPRCPFCASGGVVGWRRLVAGPPQFCTHRSCRHTDSDFRTRGLPQQVPRKNLFASSKRKSCISNQPSWR